MLVYVMVGVTICGDGCSVSWEGVGSRSGGIRGACINARLTDAIPVSHLSVPMSMAFMIRFANLCSSSFLRWRRVWCSTVLRCWETW